VEYGALQKGSAVEDVVFVAPILVVGRCYGYAVALEQFFVSQICTILSGSR